MIQQDVVVNFNIFKVIFGYEVFFIMIVSFSVFLFKILMMVDGFNNNCVYQKFVLVII